MVGIDQVKNGIAAYIESEVIGRLPGWKKWVFGAGAAFVLEKAENIYDSARESSLVKTMEIIDDRGMIDVEKVCRELKRQAEKTGDVPIEIPLVGTLKMSSNDIEVLYRKIIGA